MTTVYKTTSPDKGVNGLPAGYRMTGKSSATFESFIKIGWKLEQMLAEGHVEKIAGVPGNLAIKLPQPPTPPAIPPTPSNLGFSYWTARREWVATTTQEARDAAYAELVRAHAAELAAGADLPRCPKPDEVAPLIVIDAITDSVNLSLREVQEIGVELNEAIRNRDVDAQAVLLPQFETAVNRLKAAKKIKDDLTKFANEQIDTEIVFTSIKEVLARKSQTEWLPGLDDILERRVLAMIAGKRGTLKSFVTLEWSMRAAVAGCTVIMLSGEGGGLDRRIDAWLREHGKDIELEQLKFVALERPVNLNEQSTLDMVAAAIAKLGWESVDLMVVDTMSKFTPGLDEQDNTANAEFLYKLSAAVRYQLGASVLIVDHEGHTADGRPRGASVKMANPDAEYMVKRPDLDAYEVSITRQRFKDSPQLPDLVYTGKVIDLGRFDRDLRPITSLALHRSNAPVVAKEKKQPLGQNERTVLSEVRRCLRETPRPDGIPKGVPAERPCISWEAAVEAARGKLPCDPDRYRERAKLALKSIVSKGYLTMADDWLYAPLSLAGIPIPSATT